MNDNWKKNAIHIMDKAVFVTMQRPHKQIRKNTWKKMSKRK